MEVGILFQSKVAGGLLRFRREKKSTSKQANTKLYNRDRVRKNHSFEWPVSDVDTIAC